MRDLARVDRVLKVIRRIWIKNSQLRFTQLVQTAIGDGDNWNMEDHVFLGHLVKAYGLDPESAE